MAGHVDIRIPVDAPLDVVWRHATDHGRWGAAGHPVRDFATACGMDTFTVTTPPDDKGRSWSYRVERFTDEADKTVYSRRIGPDFLYGHVWYCYRPSASGTEMRCVVDFGMAPEADISDDEMAELMASVMRRNMTETARRIERVREGARTDG